MRKRCFPYCSQSLDPYALVTRLELRNRSVGPVRRTRFQPSWRTNAAGERMPGIPVDRSNPTYRVARTVTARGRGSEAKRGEVVSGRAGEQIAVGWWDAASFEAVPGALCANGGGPSTTRMREGTDVLRGGRVSGGIADGCGRRTAPGRRAVGVCRSREPGGEPSGDGQVSSAGGVGVEPAITRPRWFRIARRHAPDRGTAPAPTASVLAQFGEGPEPDSTGSIRW